MNPSASLTIWAGIVARLRFPARLACELREAIEPILADLDDAEGDRIAERFGEVVDRETRRFLLELGIRDEGDDIAA